MIKIKVIHLAQIHQITKMRKIKVIHLVQIHHRYRHIDHHPIPQKTYHKIINQNQIKLIHKYKLNKKQE